MFRKYIRSSSNSNIGYGTSFGVKERVRQKYSENDFEVGITSVEISQAGPITTVQV
jgi:hypothetical protein